MAEVGSPGSQDSPHSDDYGNNQGGGDRNNSSVREQDRFLPIANISRIMKKALPANAKIAKDAKETIQECVSEFISFITSEASDKCQREKRKTINGDDLLWAMSTLGFEEYVEPLKVYLHKYRETEGEKGAVINKSSGEAASGKKEGSGMMSPGVQMAQPGIYNPYMPSQSGADESVGSNGSQATIHDEVDGLILYGGPCNLSGTSLLVSATSTLEHSWRAS